MNQSPEFSLEKILNLLNGINNNLKNIKINILEMQVQEKDVIIQELKQR